MIAIEICGGIAYGETTLAHILRRLSIKPVLEDFQANPFYSAFYEDPAAYAFETEVTFSLQHYHGMKQARRSGEGFGTDFSPYLDLAYSTVTLQGEQLATYSRIYGLIRDEVEHPTLLIHLECEPQVALERVRRRGRSAELGIQLSYLQELDSALREVVTSARKSTHVLSIDSRQLDFANNDEDRNTAVEMVRSTIQIATQTSTKRGS